MLRTDSSTVQSEITCLQTESCTLLCLFLIDIITADNSYSFCIAKYNSLLFICDSILINNSFMSSSINIDKSSFVGISPAYP